jgi:chromate transport protein ChrA
MNMKAKYKIDMHSKHAGITTKQLLGYLGLIPFVIALSFQNLIIELFQQTPKQVFIFYSAVILSFIAGTLWRKKNDQLSIKRQYLSNLFSLMAFLALLIAQNLALILLAVSYLAILFCEYKLDEAKVEGAKAEGTKVEGIEIESTKIESTKVKNTDAENATAENKQYLNMRLQLTSIVVLLHIIAFSVWCW